MVGNGGNVKTTVSGTEAGVNDGIIVSTDSVVMLLIFARTGVVLGEVC